MITPPIPISLKGDGKLSVKTLEPKLFSASRPNISSTDKHGLYNFDEYQVRCAMYGPLSSLFVEAVQLAARRVWIVDPYFLDFNSNEPHQYESEPAELYESLFESCTCDLRIICSPTVSSKQQSQKLQSLLQKPARGYHAHLTPPPQIKFFNNLVPSFHDRFAIIDDELWHFGANVAGTHKDINCFSRGWSAHSTGAYDLFEKCWQQAKLG